MSSYRTIRALPVVAVEDTKRSPGLIGLKNCELCPVVVEVGVGVPRSRLAIQVNEAEIRHQLPGELRRIRYVGCTRGNFDAVNSGNSLEFAA